MYILNLVVAVLVAVTCVEATYLTIMKLRQRSLKVARGSILLDTSSVMDGRIIDVAGTGIITAELITPRSVIRELQLLADKADHDKRVRARKGLDNIRELQKLDTVSVTVVNDGLVGRGGVDERLLELAQKYDASIATTDCNLNKVAKVMEITVINVNELAQLLRAQLLPGETTDIELIQEGANREQGVGYLDDGTMVVVEDAKNNVGQKVKVEIVRSLQTEAGRMMFAKKVRSSNGQTRNDQLSGANNRKTKTNQPRAKQDKEAKPRLATVFHSDQLESSKKQSPTAPKQQRPSNQTKNTSRKSPQHRTAKSAEASMVRLANK